MGSCRPGRRSSALALIVALAAAGAACSGDDEPPDLADLAHRYPVAATVRLGAGGCHPEQVEVEVGESVVLAAEVDGVSARAADHEGYVTGELLAGERTEWAFPEPGRLALVCTGPEGTDAGLIVVAPGGS